MDAGPLQILDVPIPQPGPGQVLVKLKVCGICRTDLHVIEGELERPKLPLIPGHQAVGVISRVGSGVTERTVGERVGIAWLQGTCGQCDFCRSGRENLCVAARFTGYQVDGGYAEYAVAPARFAYPIPAVFSDEEAAPLLCAGIIGYRALRLSGIRPGQRLGLYGFGASAHIAIQIARHWGCEVYVCSLKAEQYVTEPSNMNKSKTSAKKNIASRRSSKNDRRHVDRGEDAGRVRCDVVAIVRRREGADPRVEQLDHVRAGAHLGRDVAGERLGQLREQRVPDVGLRRA